MIHLPAYRGLRIAVMGLGKSGLAAARALAAGGAEVLAWDDGAGGRAAAEAAGLPLTPLADADFATIRALVLSPGIPHTFPAPHPIAARAKAAGVPIIGDIELLRGAQPAARYVGITGTNGKSTTTALVGHVLAATGHRVQVGGNLGIPVLTFDALGADGIYVLEMSSYQLELTPSLGFDAAVLLNVTPDHLDRHGGMDGYIAAKRRIFARGARQGDGQAGSLPVAVVAVDDEPCARMADALEQEGGRRVVRISSQRRLDGGVSAPDGVLVDDSDGAGRTVLDLARAGALPGAHNWQNACAAYALCRAMGVAPADIAEAMVAFPGLAHRQQQVAVVDGIRFINDSKATNADAAAKALGCYDDLYWIVGGRPKETGLDGLEGFMPRVRRAFLIGESSDAFARWLDGKAPIQRCETLERAVPAAFEAARAAGTGVVLLSPACASFDQFPNFEVRGEAFMAAVRALADRQPGAAPR